MKNKIVKLKLKELYPSIEYKHVAGKKPGFSWPKIKPINIFFKEKMDNSSTRSKKDKTKEVDIYEHPQFKDITKSIEKTGYEPQKHGYMDVVFFRGEKKYKVLEGNHRLAILKELYDENYEIEVMVSDSMKEIIDTYVKDLYTKFTFKKVLKWFYETILKVLDTLATIPLFFIPLIFYVLGWQVANTLIGIFLIILVTLFPKENILMRWVIKKTEKNTKLNLIIFNIFKNLKFICYIVIALWLSYKFLFESFYVFLIVILISYFIKFTLEKLTDDDHATLKTVIEKYKLKNK